MHDELLIFGKYLIFQMMEGCDREISDINYESMPEIVIVLNEDTLNLV